MSLDDNTIPSPYRKINKDNKPEIASSAVSADRERWLLAQLGFSNSLQLSTDADLLRSVEDWADLSHYVQEFHDPCDIAGQVWFAGSYDSPVESQVIDSMQAASVQKLSAVVATSCRTQEPVLISPDPGANLTRYIYEHDLNSTVLDIECIGMKTRTIENLLSSEGVDVVILRRPDLAVDLRRGQTHRRLVNFTNKLLNTNSRIHRVKIFITLPVYARTVRHAPPGWRIFVANTQTNLHRSSYTAIFSVLQGQHLCNLLDKATTSTSTTRKQVVDNSILHLFFNQLAIANSPVLLPANATFSSQSLTLLQQEFENICEIVDNTHRDYLHTLTPTPHGGFVDNQARISVGLLELIQALSPEYPRDDFRRIDIARWLCQLAASEEDLLPRGTLQLSWQNLSGLNLSNIPPLEYANMQHANLSGSDFYNANLAHAKLDNCQALNTDLSRAHLKGSSLKNADLQNTDLSYSCLEQADVTGANFADANLFRTNMDNIVGYRSTK